MVSTYNQKLNVFCDKSNEFGIVACAELTNLNDEFCKLNLLVSAITVPEVEPFALP
jgi:hypothetical protein